MNFMLVHKLNINFLGSTSHYTYSQQTYHPILSIIVAAGYSGTKDQLMMNLRASDSDYHILIEVSLAWCQSLKIPLLDRSSVQVQ